MKKRIQKYSPRSLGEKKQYSILIPLLQIKGEWHLLYQVRSHNISQPGEVSFPGGQVEEGESYQEAAIRETCEELGVSPHHLDIWGEIDYLHHGEQTIHCFVAELKKTDLTQLKPNTTEVERIFTVPLNVLLKQDPTYYPLEVELKPNSSFPFEKIPNGKQYRFKGFHRVLPFYELEETIWGMTAMFTRRFIQILRK
ncbi:NUDIX hydrolase [Streptococcus cameli]